MHETSRKLSTTCNIVYYKSESITTMARLQTLSPMKETECNLCVLCTVYHMYSS